MILIVVKTLNYFEMTILLLHHKVLYLLLHLLDTSAELEIHN